MIQQSKPIKPSVLLFLIATQIFGCQTNAPKYEWSNPEYTTNAQAAFNNDNAYCSDTAYVAAQSIQIPSVPTSNNSGSQAGVSSAVQDGINRGQANAARREALQHQSSIRNRAYSNCMNNLGWTARSVQK